MYLLLTTLSHTQTRLGCDSLLLPNVTVVKYTRLQGGGPGI